MALGIYSARLHRYLAVGQGDRLAHVLAHGNALDAAVIVHGEHAGPVHVGGGVQEILDEGIHPRLVQFEFRRAGSRLAAELAGHQPGFPGRGFFRTREGELHRRRPLPGRIGDPIFVHAGMGEEAEHLEPHAAEFLEEQAFVTGPIERTRPKTEGRRQTVARLLLSHPFRPEEAEIARA